ncbi:MAG: hypothetical protein ABI665_12080 [Vicinamibacterales bacterium]
MVNRREMDPAPEHVDAVIRLEATPRLAQLARELRHPLTVTVSLLKDGLVVASAPPLTAGTKGGLPQCGELRLVFQQVFDPDSRLFLLDGVFAPDERTPSFSGFSVQGHVTSENGVTTTRSGSWTVHWNSGAGG